MADDWLAIFEADFAERTAAKGPRPPATPPNVTNRHTNVTPHDRPQEPQKSAKNGPNVTNVTNVTGGDSEKQVDPGIPPDWISGVETLRAMACPPIVTPFRWHRLIESSERFIAEWAARAAALGWDALDLWGCHRAVPEARWDHTGLLWCCDDKTILAFGETTVALQTRTGAEQMFRRHLVIGPERVLAWDLKPPSAERRISG